MKLSIFAANAVVLACFGMGVNAAATSTVAAISLSAPATTQISSGGGGVGHVFTLVNKCSYSVQPKVADTRCGYSPRTHSFPKTFS